MKTIKVVAAIIKKDNQILVAKRNYGEFENMWEFPGGKPEANETDQIALKREIMEELNINVTIDEFFMCAEYDYPTFHLSMNCYLCEMNDEHFTLSAHSDIEWLSLDAPIDAIDWIPADIQIIKKLKKRFT